MFEYIRQSFIQSTLLVNIFKTGVQYAPMITYKIASYW